MRRKELKAKVEERGGLQLTYPAQVKGGKRNSSRKTRGLMTHTAWAREEYMLARPETNPIELELGLTVLYAAY